MSLGQWTNPNKVAKTINGNYYCIYTTSIFWITEDITKDPRGGERSKWLHHPYLLRVPMVGRTRNWKIVDVVEMSKKV